MTVDWPKELVDHQRTATVTVGDVTSNPDAAGKGPPLIGGLRVRMGINTGAMTRSAVSCQVGSAVPTVVIVPSRGGLLDKEVVFMNVSILALKGSTRNTLHLPVMARRA